MHLKCVYKTDNKLCGALSPRTTFDSIVSMVKDFWEKKRHLVQMLGILLAAGALFLTIPVPESPVAREALANIQIIWLLIVTISVAILFWEFALLAVKFEEELSHRMKLDVTDTISLFAFMTLVYFIFNLWKYIQSLYGSSLMDFANKAGAGLVTFAAIIYFAISSNVRQRLSRKGKSYLWLFDFLSHAVLAILIGFGYTILSTGKLLVIESLRAAAVTYVIILTMAAIVRVRRNDFYKRLSHGIKPSSVLSDSGGDPR